ncbi:MAG TPA: YfcE family phosphodiesterase [Phycisphaerae bacterium]|nr:YfcE family phosphodiesterase [Phycisphaerae bacterium]
MLLGICSDTHNHPGMMRRALGVFDKLGVERIVHCGDVGGQAVFDELVGRDVRFVWGNTDFPGPGLRAYLETVDLTPPASVPLMLEWADRQMAVFHGHEPGFASAPQTLEVDYIFCGHTHYPQDERVGHVRVINPGALHRARPRTVATLDLITDELTFHEVPAE